MIISKTPYRISFFGGGTDYPNWYKRYGGEVLSSTINKYIFISSRFLPSFFDHKYRIVYSDIELVNKVKEIRHSVIREIIKKTKIKHGIELHYDGDLPARSGMGSSSSFVVGCMHVFYSLINKKLTKEQLAFRSVEFEQKVLKEIVGSQDQVAAAYGGFKNGNYKVNKLKIKNIVKKNLNKRLFLVYTGNQRRAHDIASVYVKDLHLKKKQMFELLGFVEKAKKYLLENKLDDFGDLLNESWHKKKELSKNISSGFFDEIYSLALRSGALGGKILGAGGGGFFLFYVEENKIQNFLKKFDHLTIIPFEFEEEGSKIIFNNQNG